ncbi:MAG: DNRLRE domain-containing protein [Archangiaceae bacterium]|nr:DNRLRE domain-containing protein [Archangiaceae bacterium]
MFCLALISGCLAIDDVEPEGTGNDDVDSDGLDKLDDALAIPYANVYPADDTYADSANPNKALGSSKILGVDAAPKRAAFLKFDVKVVPPAAKVKQALLRMYAYNGSPQVQGPSVYQVSNSWSEDTLTWNRKPARISSTTLDHDGKVPVGSWVELDVTDAVKGNGVVSFEVAQIGTNGNYFRSNNDSVNRPRLTVRLTPSVGPNGGKVDLMRFIVTGDTRPGKVNDTKKYPTAIIKAIADQANLQKAQFALDVGDHFYANTAKAADTQMDYYDSAISRFRGTWFLTMGNHECMSSGDNCASDGSGGDPLNTRYLKSVKSRLDKSKPYYTVDVGTRYGIARFIFIADNANRLGEQDDWLRRELAKADDPANNIKYTIPVRHHPSWDPAEKWASNILREKTAAGALKHKIDLLLTGHYHSYRHPNASVSDLAPRELVVGIGGAPASFYGYALVEQMGPGAHEKELRVTMYENGSPPVQKDQFYVKPLRP